MNKLIVCPKCLKKGVTRYLGMLFPDGRISIKRTRSRFGGEWTIIKGRDFDLFCGNCGSKILKRR